MPRKTLDLATWIEQLENRILLLEKELRDLRQRLQIPPME